MSLNLFRCNFLEYFSLMSAIPNKCKSSLKREVHHHVVDVASTQLAVVKLTCTTIYNNLINQQQCPPTAERRLTECGFGTQQRESVYSLPFCVMKEVKLSACQYKVIHNILIYKNCFIQNEEKTSPLLCLLYQYRANDDSFIIHMFSSRIFLV